MKEAKRSENGGVPATNNLPYPNLVDGEKSLQICDLPFWQRTVVIIFLVVGLSCLDAVTIFTVIDNVMVENQYISIFLVGGLALTLNFIPLIVGHILRKRYYGLARYPLWSLLALGLTFLLLFALTVYLRWETRELNFSGTEGLIIDTTSQNSFSAQTASKDGPIATAVTLLLATLPLITSIINVYLGYISDDPVLKKIHKLRLRRIELMATIADLRAAKSEMENDRIGRLTLLDSERFGFTKEEIMARCENMRCYVRFRLAEHLGQPEQITKLTEE